jgi:hypothetical protein
MVHFYNVGSFYGKYQLMNLLVVNIYRTRLLYSRLYFRLRCSRLCFRLRCSRLYI